MHIGLTLGLTGVSAPSLITQAIAAIRRNNGTALYVPDDYGLVLGPELVTNGGFDSATGWGISDDAGGLTTISDGMATLTNTTGTCRLSQTVAFATGKNYRISWTQTGASIPVYTGSSETFGTVAVGQNTRMLTATASSNQIGFRNFTAGTSVAIDNISVREILSATTYQSSTGIQPVTAVGDLVGLLTDRSYGSGKLGVNVSTGSSWSKAANAWQASPYVLKAGTLGKAYRVTFTVSTVTAGSVIEVFRRNAADGANEPVGSFTVSAGGTYSGQVTIVRESAVILEACWLDGFAFAGTVTGIEWKEVLDNHASQGTTASKPLVTRVPKRLGPNLVVNGGFDVNASGWTGNSATLTHSAGAVLVTASAIAGRIEQADTLETGKSYVASIDVTIGTATGGVRLDMIRGAGGGYAALGTSQVLTSGTQKLVTPVFVATGTDVFFQAKTTGGSGTFTVDNATLQEVLEWTPALDFDGSNDLLTLSSGAILQQGSDHFVTAAFVLDAVGAAQAFYGASSTASNTPLVAMLSVNASPATLACLWRDDAGVSVQPNGVTALVAGVPCVATAAKVGSTYSLWLNGVLVQSATATLGTTTLNTANIGALVRTGVSHQLNGKIIDIALGQSTLTEADRKTIERNMAQRAGVTYVG